MLCCATEQTSIYQSRICKDNQYNTCKLSLASAAARVILKNCYTHTMKCRTQRGVCCRVPKRRNTILCPGAQVNNFTLNLTPRILWVILTFKAPYRCKIPLLFLNDAINCNTHSNKKRISAHLTWDQMFVCSYFPSLINL